MSDESHSFLTGNLSKTLGNSPRPLLQAAPQPVCMKATPHAGTLQTPKEPLSSDPYINVHALGIIENVHLLTFTSEKNESILKVFSRVLDASTCTRRVPCPWSAPPAPSSRSASPFDAPLRDCLLSAAPTTIRPSMPPVAPPSRCTTATRRPLPLTTEVY